MMGLCTVYLGLFALPFGVIGRLLTLSIRAAGLNKQCRRRSDTAKYSVSSRATPFTTYHNL